MDSFDAYRARSTQHIPHPRRNTGIVPRFSVFVKEETVQPKIPLPTGWTMEAELTGSIRGQRDMNISVYDAHRHRVAYVDYSVAFQRHDLRKDGGSIPDRHGVKQTDDYGREWRSGYARDEVFIKMIEVAPEYRRRGLGMALLQAIADSERLPINSGMRTDDGGKLWKAWVRRPTRLPEEVTAAGGR